MSVREGRSGHSSTAFRLLHQLYNCTSAVKTPETHDDAARNRAKTGNAKRNLSVDCGRGAMAATTKSVRADFETLQSVLRLHGLSNLSEFRWKIIVDASLSK